MRHFIRMCFLELNHQLRRKIWKLGIDHCYPFYSDLLVWDKRGNLNFGVLCRFPMFFPLRTPICVDSGSHLEVHFWRCVDYRKVDYVLYHTYPALSSCIYFSFHFMLLIWIEIWNRFGMNGVLHLLLHLQFTIVMVAHAGWIFNRMQMMSQKQHHTVLILIFFVK
jgi:hypothetical protein